MTAADELYALPPEDFTARRTALAKQAKAGGDKELAEVIGALRKPSTAAWALNVTARTDPDAFTDLLAMGAALRDAQRDLAASELRRLMHERHAVVAAALDRIRAASDRPLSPAIVTELDAALRAAMGDPDFAERLTSGTLVTTVADEAELPEVDVRSKPAKKSADAPKVNRALERAEQAEREAEAGVAALTKQREALETEAEELARRFNRLEDEERRAAKALDTARRARRKAAAS